MSIVYYFFYDRIGAYLKEKNGQKICGITIPWIKSYLNLNLGNLHLIGLCLIMIILFWGILN